MNKQDLCGLTADEIFDFIELYGFNLKQAKTISNCIYKKGCSNFNEVPGISKILIATLNERAKIGLVPPVASQISEDGTVKYLFRTSSGLEFETVFIPDARRNTVCVSTQSGCRMGCPFCVTSGYGFRGNLSAGEIVNQVISLPDAEKITHVVFMGMGEPMDNLENVLKACDILTAEWGIALSLRNITVSTVGITPSIRKFLELSSCNLTVSLHSPFSEERQTIVPAEKKFPVHDIIEILKNYPVRKKRRFTIAYLMIKDFNDSDLHLAAIKNLLKDSGIRVNLLPYHKIPDDLKEPSSDERLQTFKHELVISGISASIRRSRGSDISAACGLLATGLKF